MCQLGSQGHGQGNKMMNADIDWKCLPQEIYVYQILILHCMDKKSQAKLKFKNRRTDGQGDKQKLKDSMPPVI